MIKEVLIETPKGIGKLDKIYVSELGFLMIKFVFDDGTFTGYNLGKHDPNNNIFTKELIKQQPIRSTRD